MRIDRISVTGLFGIFDHAIPLNTKDRITIIHGPNGFGKTIILSMLHGLFNSRYSIFRGVPFREFRVDFDDGTALQVEKTPGGTKAGSSPYKVLVVGPQSRQQVLDITVPGPTPAPSPGMLGALEEIPDLEQAGYDRYRNVLTGQTLSMEEALEDYDLAPGASPAWLRKIQEALRVRHIRTDRLSARSTRSGLYGRAHRGEAAVPVVVRYSRDMVRMIERTLAESVELSSSLDRSFPQRLLDRTARNPGSKMSDQDLRQKLKRLEEKRFRLTEAGLLDKGSPTVRIPDGDIDPVSRSVLCIYVKDAQEKLQVFDQLLDKIELMRKLIEKRFLYKKFSFSKEKGFVFRTPDGKSLATEALSSGEQHLVALLYELLFRVAPNSLVLIDEPEISLHIAWQHDFVDDLAEIAAICDFDAIVATHSPDIVSDRWDLTVELKGPEYRA
jgi:predicted ATP-binding protein involved in virulence